MFSIKTKIIFSYTLVFGIILITFACFIYQNNAKTGFEKIQSNLKSYSNLIDEEMEEEINENDSLNIREIKSINPEGLYDVKIEIYDKNYSAINSGVLPLQGSKEEIKNSFSGHSLFKTVEFEKQRYLCLWSPFEIGNDTIFVVQIAASLKELDSDLDKMFWFFVIIIPFALIITSISAYYISKNAFKPIMKMIDTAKIISERNLDQRLILPKKKDEVFLLGKTFNEMISRLETSFQSQKQFIMDASHQIRTPLTIIQSEIELAIENIENKQNEKNLKIALTEIENLNSLAQSLLTISKIDSSQFRLTLQKHRIDELLLECLQIMKLFAAQKLIQFKISIQDAFEINIDREKIKTALLNIIDNAIKYSAEGTTVYIELKQEKPDIIIIIKDEGMGISAEDLTKVFERFYRSNDVRSKIPGNGLGLAISRSVIEMHRGNISVFSQPEKGSKFIISLPYS